MLDHKIHQSLGQVSMEDKTAITRVDRDDHPHRCQHVNNVGQCHNLAVELRDGAGWSEKCLVHGGNASLIAQDKAGLKNYRLTKYQQRLGELRSNAFIKDLRDELAILRMILEEKLNSVANPTDLILQSGNISDMVMKIERLVTSCQKLEDRLGVTIDKAKVIAIAEQIIAIISLHEKDTTVLEAIANDIEKMMRDQEKN